MDKPKSKVNAAGVYTKPAMRKALFNGLMAGSAGVLIATGADLD